ncbi:MAG TPA: hypothetical protein VLG69_01755 [Candidatus Andersenbacteria bacterium]|nr:hypothetical protein [Candidatus Andersenbacteria bacterium]
MVGTCTGCGTENVELNEAGLCAMCAGNQETPSTDMPSEPAAPAM